MQEWKNPYLSNIISRSLVGERCWCRLREYHRRIWTWTGKIELDSSLKVAQRRRIDVELPLQVGAHLPLHLVDLPKREHTLTDSAPRLVRVSSQIIFEASIKAEIIAGGRKFP